MTIAIRNALPEAVASDVRKIFVESDTWQNIPFADVNYYDSVYRYDARAGIPRSGETYTTNFDRSEYLAGCQQTRDAVNQIADLIDPIIDGDIVIDRPSISLLAYRLRPGGHLRIHHDKYGADIGFIWYLSREWKWDWGGLLVSVRQDNSAEVEIPEFNKLVIINHSETVSHCVTSVETWAQDNRYMIVGLMRVKKK